MLKATCDLATIWLQQDLCPHVISHDDGGLWDSALDMQRELQWIQQDCCLFAAQEKEGG